MIKRELYVLTAKDEARAAAALWVLKVACRLASSFGVNPQQAARRVAS